MAVAIESPAMLAEEALWSLSKDTQSAGAVLRRIEGIGLELRFIWNGELAHSQVYRDVQDLLRASNTKREELEGRGWATSSTSD
jgi:hypothetical protein